MRENTSEWNPTAVAVEVEGIVARTPGVNKVNSTPGTIMSVVVTFNLKPNLIIRKLRIQRTRACILTCVKKLEFGGIPTRKIGLKSAKSIVGVSTLGAVMSIIYHVHSKKYCTTYKTVQTELSHG